MQIRTRLLEEHDLAEADRILRRATASKGSATSRRPQQQHSGGSEPSSVQILVADKVCYRHVIVY
jgi:hypothetical protein